MDRGDDGSRRKAAAANLDGGVPHIRGRVDLAPALIARALALDQDPPEECLREVED